MNYASSTPDVNMQEMSDEWIDFDSMGFTMIRPFQEGDTERLIEIWYTTSMEAHAFVPDDFWEREREVVRNKYIPITESYMFEEDGVAVAFISLLEPDEVGALFVLPQYQGRGIGSKLILHAADLKGSLRLSAFKENPKAIQFSEKWDSTSWERTSIKTAAMPCGRCCVKTQRMTNSPAPIKHP